MQAHDRYLTVEQYIAFGDQPVEVVNGEAIMAAAHTRRQPNVATNLFGRLHPYVRRNKLGKVFLEASFVLDSNPRSKWVAGARPPDLAFISRERILAHDAEHPEEDEPWWLAPDLAVEIVSPTDSYAYLTDKVADYLRFGVGLVWVIDADARLVRVHTPEQPLGHTLRETDKLAADPVIRGWSMKVADLFVRD